MRQKHVKNKNYFLFVSFGLLISGQAAYCETVSFKITPPSEKPKLAEPFKLRIEASYGANYALKIDTAAIDGEFFQILKIRKLFSKEADAARTDEFECEAAAFSLGVSTFPEITFQLSGADSVMEAKSPSFQLEIEPLFEKAKTGESADIKDIYPPLKFIPWLWLIAAFLVLCALGAFLYARRKKPAAAAAYETQKDDRTPYRRAMDGLEALSACGLWEEGKIKDFYVGFSGIFRLYLKEQFAIDALLMTTTGLSRELKKTGAEVQTLIKSRELLERSDLVKFAKFKPQQKDSDLSCLEEILGELTRHSETEKARNLPPSGARLNGAGSTPAAIPPPPAPAPKKELSRTGRDTGVRP